MAAREKKKERPESDKIRKIFAWAILPLILLVLNIYLVRDLFTLEYTDEMGSIESAFIADARYITEHGGTSTWNPQWYAGFPFRFFYPPAFHYLVAFIHTLFTHLSISLVYHFVTALFYSLGAVCLYFFVHYFTKRTLPAFMAGFLFTLLPSFSYLVPAVKSMGETYHFAPWRLVVLLVFGEGPHISALSILPLVLLAFLWALRKPSFKAYVMASLAVAVIPLTNWPTTISLAVSLLALIVCELFKGEAIFKIKRSFLIIVTAYGLSAFWLTLSYIYTTFAIAGPRAGGGFLTSYLSILPWLIIIGPFLVSILIALFNKKPKRYLWSFVTIYIIIFSIIIFTGYFSGIKIVPESNRFTPEWNMGMVILIALILGFIYKKLEFRKKVINMVLKAVFILIITGLTVYLGWPFLLGSGENIKENPDITKSVEYEIAHWLKENTNGERIYATGSIAFWLNAFTDVPQVRGGSDQGATNPWFNHATFQINTSTNAPRGKAGELAILWLKAFNVRYLVFNKPQSREAFHDFLNPEKFEGLLKEVYNEKGDIIYQVPLKNPSLAQVVDSRELDKLFVPVNAVDYEAIYNYTQVVDTEAREADFEWRDNEEARISAEVNSGEVVSLQITHHAGWQAWADGKRIPIEKDILGFMVLNPGQGKHSITLKHGYTWDESLGFVITFSTILLIIIFRIKKGKKWLYADLSKIRKREKDDEE